MNDLKQGAQPTDRVKKSPSSSRALTTAREVSGMPKMVAFLGGSGGRIFLRQKWRRGGGAHSAHRPYGNRVQNETTLQKA